MPKKRSTFLTKQVKDVAFNPPSEKLAILLEKTLFLGQKLTAVYGDILTVTADAVVIPTNKNFLMIGDLGRALEMHGGSEFRNTLETLRKENGDLPLTRVVLSSSINSSTKYMMLCNSPVLYGCGGFASVTKCSDGIHLLEKAIKNCLRLADGENFKSVALPFLSSNRTEIHSSLLIEITVRTIKKYFMSVMSSSLIQIYFVLSTKELGSETVVEMQKALK